MMDQAKNWWRITFGCPVAMVVEVRRLAVLAQVYRVEIGVETRVT